MLDLAFNHSDELNRQYSRMMLNIDKYKYVFTRNWTNYKIEIDDNNWNKLQYVSVTYNPYRVHGYFKCDINRSVHYVYAMVVINFDDKPSFVFAKDFRKFLYILVHEYKFNKIQFGCVVGNPIEKKYDILVQRNFGRIVGIYKKDERLIDNKIYDVKMYEIDRTSILLSNPKL